MSPSSSNPVFAALDAAGLRYAVRHTRAGDPYAGFQWASGDIPEMSLTAILHDGAARFTVHDLALAPALGAAALSDRMRQMPLVRVFRSPDVDAVELVAAFDVTGGQLEGWQLIALLVYLGHARAFVLGESEVAIALPAFDPAPPRIAPVDLLGQLGLAAEADPAGAAVEIALPGTDARTRVVAGVGDGGSLTVAGGLSSPAPLVLREDQMKLVDRLQNWAPVGRFLLSPRLELGAEVTCPLFGRPPAAVLRGSLDRLSKLLGTARMHAAR